MSNDIIDIHEKCLDFLLDYQRKTSEFYFIPRKINNKNRLSEGMYFRGNEKYLVLSFWNSSDSKEFIYNISFQVNAKGQASIELSCRDDDKKLPHIIAIKDIIGKDFETKNKKNRWRHFYPANIYFLDALSQFISEIKPKIDDYVLLHPECNLPLADKEIDDMYVKTLPIYKVYKESTTNEKTTGSVMVKPSEYFMSFQHNKLSNELVKYLNSNGYSSVVTEEDFIDIKAIDSNGKKLLFELKTATRAKSAIRQALGQLLEYNHYSTQNKADKLIIVSEAHASPDDIKYLKTLREQYSLPVYYQQFDIDKKVLTAEI